MCPRKKVSSGYPYITILNKNQNPKICSFIVKVLVFGIRTLSFFFFTFLPLVQERFQQ